MESLEGGGAAAGGGGVDCFWGETPATEKEYYAAQGIEGTQSFFTVQSSSTTLFTRSWRPDHKTNPNPIRGIVCMIHGYGNDISWTFQSTPVFLARNGYACFAPDLPGHGRSPGLRGFVPDVDSVAADIAAYFDSCNITATTTDDDDGCKLPRFLYGESMGGAICLLLHLSHRPSSSSSFAPSWSGAVLAAPMCRISDRIRPPWPLPLALTLLARIAPTLPVVPTADLVEKSVKVEAKRLVAARNPLRYNGRPRLGTVRELLRVTDDLNARLSEVTLPFLVLHGSADVVTDPDVSRALHAAARSEDKTIRIYEGMMHSLLFGETDDNIDLVRGDILSWLNQRSPLPPSHQQQTG